MTLVRKLEDLKEKYRLLLMMRLEREALESQGILKLEGDAAAERRESSKALAARFPGALKELDRLSASELERRLQRLEQVGAEGQDLPQWAQVVWEYHHLFRQVLGVKAWLVQKKTEAADSALVLRAWRQEKAGFYQSEDWPLAYQSERLLELIQNPPNGRLSHLVMEVLRERFGITDEELRILIFEAHDD